MSVDDAGRPGSARNTLVCTVGVTLGVLSVFRWIEARMPAQGYYHLDVRFARAAAMAEPALRALVEQHHFSGIQHRADRGPRIR